MPSTLAGAVFPCSLEFCPPLGRGDENPVVEVGQPLHRIAATNDNRLRS